MSASFAKISLLLIIEHVMQNSVFPRDTHTPYLRANMILLISVGDTRSQSHQADSNICVSFSYIGKTDSITISIWNHKKIHKRQGAGFLGCIRLLSNAISRLKDTGCKSGRVLCDPLILGGGGVGLNELLLSSSSSRPASRSM